jgi:hypothetical protein
MFLPLINLTPYKNYKKKPKTKTLAKKTSIQRNLLQQIFIFQNSPKQTLQSTFYSKFLSSKTHQNKPCKAIEITPKKNSIHFAKKMDCK